MLAAVGSFGIKEGKYRKGAANQTLLLCLQEIIFRPGRLDRQKD